MTEDRWGESFSGSVLWYRTLTDLSGFTPSEGPQKVRKPSFETTTRVHKLYHGLEPDHSPIVCRQESVRLRGFVVTYSWWTGKSVSHLYVHMGDTRSVVRSTTSVSSLILPVSRKEVSLK